MKKGIILRPLSSNLIFLDCIFYLIDSKTPLLHIGEGAGG
jgi:hypothetical protein